MKDLIKNLILSDKLNLHAFFFANLIALFEISIAMPLELFNSLNKLTIIHPVPVPISSIVIFFFLKIVTSFSTSSSVSGLGIKVFLFTKNFLLQNSFSPSK